jgi:NAD(P)-dependent dehydrogenase (short-subunit alcohol dehydrogenase family)
VSPGPAPHGLDRLGNAPASLFSLEGRVAVVTGASSGIGVELAEGLASAGARVVVAARRQGRLEELAARLEAAGHECVAIECDVSEPDSVDALLGRCLDHYGQVDILVNNAGITEVVPAQDETLECWDRVVGVNLRGLFVCCQRFGRVMLESRRGSIVNVASVLGQVAAGQVPQASYAASKGGVVNLTRELAAQWARSGVRVNAIAPGWFESEMTADMFADERSRKWMRTRTPMGRSGQAGELTGALLFLASDASTFVTGQTITVDGGWTIV